MLDLSAAFDTLNREFLIAKPHAYGFTRDSLRLINNYLSNRWQRTKINKSFSSWAESITYDILKLVFLHQLFY